jgi:hypothetical protein
MKYQNWLAVAAAVGIALTGCSSMQSASRDSDQSSSSSSGTMRRAESGSNTTPNTEARGSDCLPGDARTNCQEKIERPQPQPESSTDSSADDSADAETPGTGEPVPR